MAVRRRPDADGAKWRNVRKRVIQRDQGICHLCRAMGCHATCADSADHDPIPYSECEARGINPLDMSNIKAAHFKPCPWCGVKCQKLKFNGSIDAFRIKWEKATGRKAVNPLDREIEPEGREW
jgi:hypothetical protein